MNRTERIDSMVADYFEHGLTLQEIGTKHDLTRERVRQLLYPQLERLGLNGYQVRRARTKREREAAMTAIYPAVERLARDGKSRDEIQEALASSADRVHIRHALQQVPKSIWRLRVREAVQNYSDEEILRYIKLGHIYSGKPDTLSHYTYDELARQHGWPTWQTARSRFGSWRTACTQAGVATRARKRTYARFTPEECIDAVWQTAKQIGHLPSTVEYDNVRDKNLPAQTTIRNRCGPWSTVLAQVYERIEAEPTTNN